MTLWQEATHKALQLDVFDQIALLEERLHLGDYVDFVPFRVLVTDDQIKEAINDEHKLFAKIEEGLRQK